MAGLGLVLHHGIESGAALASYGRLADDAGYDSLWVTERYCHEETFTLLGHLAATTTRVRLGAGVVNPYGRHPVLTAMAAATLDRVSGGRFVLGLGRSERQVVEGTLGLSHRASRERLRETTVAIRALLGGARVTGAGGGSAILAIRPVQTPLPIHLAAIGRRALRLAGEIADGVVLNAYVSPECVRWAVREIHAAARAAGRDPAAIEIGCMLVVRLGDDLDALRPTLKPRLVRLLAEPHTGETLLETGGFDAGVLPRIRAAVAAGEEARALPLVTDAMVDACYVAGPAARCRERVRAYREAGVESPLLLPRLADYHAVAAALAGA
jgi:5,10-methylenetetrahydromethanopterin reductase